MAGGFFDSIFSPLTSWWDEPPAIVYADPDVKPGSWATPTNSPPNPYTVTTTVYKQGEPSWLWSLAAAGLVGVVGWTFFKGRW